MISNVTETEFIQRFYDLRNDNFSYEGKKALFEYIEEIEDSTGEQIEFDCIAICCEYTEFENLKDFHKYYDKENYPDLDTLREYTQVIEIEDSDSFIIADF
ncbi:hypothetical protein CMI37_38705 [Candidatus Pacearchaeota archaeon]|jgi:hypothetical protein|nr:hypothetical protein [Candidatus Pacearchaeota archaeon]|tara:strand:- start:209 stop:511 length:303 start_codon:yes stop_codon:yes gene_type:complete